MLKKKRSIYRIYFRSQPNTQETILTNCGRLIYRLVGLTWRSLDSTGFWHVWTPKHPPDFATGFAYGQFTHFSEYSEDNASNQRSIPNSLNSCILVNYNINIVYTNTYYAIYIINLQEAKRSSFHTAINKQKIKKLFWRCLLTFRVQFKILLFYRIFVLN